MANLKASTVNGVLTLSSISGAGQTVPNSYGAYLHLGSWADGRTAAGAVLVNTAYRADYATDLFDMNISRFTNNSGYISAFEARGASGDFYIDDDYGKSIIGLYASDRYQGVYSMGDAYKLAGNGTTPGNLYGIAWTHTNVGGQSKAGLGHQALFMMNGTTYTAIGDGIWTNGTITTGAHGTSANWKTAYDWGNHASAGYAASGHNHTYNVNDDWLRENGDNANFKIYGNSRSVIYRTDGVTNEHGGGDYPHIWYYGGSDDGNRVMIINTSGQLWMSNYGWLHDYFQIASSAINTGNIGSQSVNYAASAGSAPANGGRADTVTINYNNDSNSTYQMLWGSGNSVYGSSAIYCNPNSDTIYSTSLRGASNVAGTGEATHHPAGIYSQGNNWLYGPLYINGNSMYDVNLAYISTIYDRDNNGWYVNPGELSNMNILYVDRIDNYGYITNSNWNTAGMLYVGEAGDTGAYPIQCNAVRWDLSIYAPNGPIWGNGIRDISDIKKKTNIASITDPISKIKDLRGVTYQWKDINDGKTHAGFIAQEVEVVLPDLVSTTVDPDTLGEIKGVAYSEVIPYLVEAMKVQQNLIEDLQARLAILENNS